MKYIKHTILFFSLGLLVFSCKNAGEKNTSEEDVKALDISIQVDTIQYRENGIEYISFIYHDTTISKKRPAILVIPEWWGVNDYTKSRARQFAGLGYIAMATDMYGNAKIAATPDEATTLSDPFYANPTLTKTVLDVAMREIKTFPQTDTNKIAAIGYCYGGYVVLNAAKLGVNLKAVISVHGGLEGVAPDKNLLKAKILICQGGADSFTLPGLPAFKKQMDSVGADYSVIVYPNATHAFSNPAATELGEKFNMPIRYNAAADSASWKDIQAFLQKTF